MGAIAEARSHMATTLAALGVPVYDYPPGAIQPPAAIVLAGSPYCEPTATWGAVAVGLDVRLVVGDSPTAPQTLDTLIDAALAAFAGADIQAGAVSAPIPDEQGVLVVDIPTTTTVTPT